MASENLGLKITASLNIGASVGEINTQLKALAKHPSLQKLDLKINIDKSFISNISSLSRNLNTITSQLQQQSVANNNVNNSLKNTTQSIQEQTKATNEAIKAESKWRLMRERTNKAGTTTSTSENGYRKQITTTMKDGSNKDIVDIVDYSKKYKELENIDRAHYNALKDNKARIEAMEKVHYLALQKNRELDWKNLQAANKQAEALDKAHYQAIKMNSDMIAKNQKQTQSLINSAFSGKQNVNSVSNGIAEAKALEVLNRQYDKVLSNLNAAKNSGKQLSDSELTGINRRVEALNSLANKQRQVEKDRATLSSTQLRAETQVNNLLNGRYKNKVDSAQLTNLLSQLKDLNTSVPNFKGQAKEITDQINRIGSEAKNTTPNVQGLGDKLKLTFNNMLMYSGIGSIFYGAINAFKSGVQHIFEIDAAMTDLRKVTDETTSTYNRFLVTANETANTIGGVTTDVIKSTTEWARLGYSISQAQMLAKQTLVYQNVGDIKSAEDASKSLISTIKGFGIEVDNEGKNITKIVDIYNEVGNKFAISSAGIGEALRRSAASLSEAGNSIEQSVALATAANSTIQDPARVGQMLKTVSMRLRGVSEEGEDLTDLIPSLEKKFKAIGLTLQKDENTFKSTYEIFQDLAGVWGKLNDFQRADILESVAGKLQGNIASSLITNFADAENALAAGLNSAGSAARENEKYINSIAGRVAIFKNAVEEFWAKSIDSSVIKGIVDTGTQLIGVFGNLGNVVLIATGLLIAFKGKAIWGMAQSLVQLINSFGSTSVALNGVSLSAGGATVALTTLQRAIPWIGLAAAGLSVLYYAFNKSSNSIKDHSQAIEDANKKYEELAFKLQDTEEYYKQNFDSMQNNSDVKNKLFEMQNELIDSFGLESKGLDLVNGKYDEQIAKLKDLNKEKLNNELKDANLRVQAAKEVKYNSTINGNMGSGLLNRDFTLKGAKSLDVEQYYKDLLALKEKIYAQDKNIFDSSTLPANNAREWEAVLNAVQDKLEEIKPTIEDIASTERKQRDKLKNDALESFKDQVKLNDKQKEFLESINSIAIKSPIKDYEKEIKGIIGISSELNESGSNFVSIINTLKAFEMFKGNPELITQLDNFMHSSLEAKSSVINLQAALNNINKSFEDNSSSVKELNEVISELNKGNTFNTETAAELIKNYPKLAKYAKETAKGWTFEKDAVVALRNEKIAFFREDVENEKKNALNVVNAGIQRLKAYGLEVKSVNSLAEAKQALVDIDKQLNAPKKSSVIAESGTNLYPFLPDSFGVNISKRLLENVDEYNNAIQQKNDAAAKTQREQLAKNIKDMEDYASSADALLKGMQDPNYGVKEEKANNKLNDSYSDTVEVLTELQKRMKEIDKLRDDEIRKRSRLRKDSKEYQDSLRKENDLLKEKIKLGKEGIEDPSKLVATKVTTTTKTNDLSTSSSSSSTASTGSPSLNNMFAAFGGLEGKFKYSQSKSGGTYDQFVNDAISDCSLFVQQMFKEFMGVDLGRDTSAQFKNGTTINKIDDLQAGDLVFFDTNPNKQNGHVGIYKGNGKFEHVGVKSGLSEQNINNKYWSSKFTSGKRVLSDSQSVSVPSPSSTGKTSVKNGNTTVKTDGPTQKEMVEAVENQTKQNNDNDDQIYQNNLLILESIKEGFDRKIQEQEDFIDKSKRVQEKLDPNSVAWRKENEKQVNAKGAIQGIQHEAKTTLQAEMKALGIESNDWDDVLKKLSSDWLDVQSEKFALLIQNFNSQIDSSKQRISDLDNLVEQSKNRMSQFDVGSPEYNKQLNLQIELTKKQNKENENLKKSLEILANSTKLDPATRKQFKEMLDELNLKDYTSDIKDLNAELIASKATPLTKSIDDINHRLDISKATLKGYKEGTEEYNKELKNQISLNNELVTATKKLKDYAEKQSQNEELSASVRGEYKKQVQELTISLLDYADAIKDIRETYADNVIEKYKKVLQEQQKLRNAAYDKEKEAEDARHETRMSNLDDEMSKFEDVINAQSKSLDREVAGEDYADQLAKLQKEKSELDAKFSSLSLDDSLEAKSKRADLQKEIDAKAEEITKLQRDREITIRKEGLSDQLEDRKAAVDKAKKLEDDQNKSILKGIEANKKLNDDYYDGLLNDEQYFYSMKQNLMSEDTVKIQNELSIVQAAYDTFFKELEKNSGVYASKISSNLKYTLGLDKDYANNFPTSVDNGNSNNAANPVTQNPIDSSPVSSMNKRNAAWDEYLSNKQKAEQMQLDMKTLVKDSADYKNKQAEIKRLQSINEGYRKQYGFQDGSYDYLSKLTKYHTGGIVGEKGTTTKSLLENDEIPAILKKGEGIIDKPRDFFKEITGNVMNNLSNILSNFNVSQIFKSPLQPAPVDNSLSIRIDNVIGDKQGAKVVTDSIEDFWKRKTNRGW